MTPWRTAVPRLSRFAVEHLLLLPLGALIALVWVNTRPESYFTFAYAIAFAVNDVAMVFFFALIAKEVVEATAPNGVLHPWRRALLPVVASIGAATVPALIHIQVVDALDEPMLAEAWPVALAVDLAVTYFVARVIFRRHPIIPFLLLLGIASDALGILALAMVSPAIDVRVMAGALIFAAAIATAVGLRRARVKSFWPYLIAAGGLSWYAFFYSGLHPALALVPIMPFLPHAARDPGFFVDAPPEAKDTLSRFELWWKYPAQIALFFFGLVNAGVPFGALEAGTWGLPIAVIVGKPVGVLIGAGAAMLIGLHLPSRVTWRDLTIGGLIVAVGFSVGLFFTSALLPPGQLRSEMYMGVLLSLAAAPLAVVAAKIMGVGRLAPE
ncbi:MAG TPA: Na+/H+ antiporter NhaA [Vicinamibacterales bacterium]|nr:Na+/H+ antiporter NhaA [Vicinamibacterales bacterium]